MKTDIILAGVGGQGILSIATAIGVAALKKGLQLKQAETHGMSQRGGAVVSHLRISDKTVYSDLIAKGDADLILSVEPMEAMRYLPYLSKNGYIVTNTAPFLNIPDYPELDKVMEKLNSYENVVAIDADKIASDLGSKIASNMVMLGAASPFLNDVDAQILEDGIVELFSRKGEDVVNTNLEAFRAGRKFAEEVLAK
jgi:indolepyruvate ferredoxin oxidoreductase beta subunit